MKININIIIININLKTSSFYIFTYLNICTYNECMYYNCGVLRLNDLLLFSCENSLNMCVCRSEDKNCLLQWEYRYHYVALTGRIIEEAN